MPTGSEIVTKAADVAADYQARTVTYLMGADASSGGTRSDCSHFVLDVLTRAGLSVDYTSTGMMSGSSQFTRVQAKDAKAGDVIVQGGHMGIFNGQYARPTQPLGYQMGGHGATIGTWGPGGWFASGNSLTFYRPRGVN